MFVAFFGFAPVKSGQKESFFRQILESGITTFFFESPYRIAKTLELIAQLAPEREIAIIREATKIHEEVLRGSAGELAKIPRNWKGEFVIGISKYDVQKIETQGDL